MLQLVEARGEVRRADVVALCRLSDDQATRLLKRLVRSGRLVAEGVGKGAWYHLPT